MNEQLLIDTQSNQVESFSIDLCVALLSSTKPLNEKKLAPLVIK